MLSESWKGRILTLSSLAPRQTKLASQWQHQVFQKARYLVLTIAALVDTEHCSWLLGIKAAEGVEKSDNFPCWRNHPLKNAFRTYFLQCILSHSSTRGITMSGWQAAHFPVCHAAGFQVPCYIITRKYSEFQQDPGSRNFDCATSRGWNGFRVLCFEPERLIHCSDKTGTTSGEVFLLIHVDTFKEQKINLQTCTLRDTTHILRSNPLLFNQLLSNLLEVTLHLHATIRATCL